MTRRKARKKMTNAVGRLSTPCERNLKVTHSYRPGTYYRVEDICKALGVSIEDFFKKSFRKEITLFNCGIWYASTPNARRNLNQ